VRIKQSEPTIRAMTKANANVKLLKTIPGIREFFSLPLTFNIHITSCLNMENGPRPVSCSGLLFADRSARRFVAAAVTVTVDAAARFVGVSDQRAGHTTDCSANRCPTHIACRHTTDNSAGCGTDAGPLLGLGTRGERENEEGCEEDLFHDWFLFKGVDGQKSEAWGRSDAAHQHEDEEYYNDQSEAT
jgi:hypothetical protein